MDQRNERFVPHVLADRRRHLGGLSQRRHARITTCSRSRRPTTSTSGATPPGESKAVRFDRPGIVRVFCEIHSHMSAFILVFAHRFFAVTDDEGRYRLDGVPPGTYTRGGVERDRPRRSAAADRHHRRGGRRRRGGLHHPMNAFSSLTNRIFFATALLAVLSIAVAIYIVNRAVTRQADAELQRGIDEAATLVEEYRKFSFETFGREARLIADLPSAQGRASTRTTRRRSSRWRASTRTSSPTPISSRSPTTPGGSSSGWAPATCRTRRSRPPPPSARTAGRSATRSGPSGDGILLIKSVPIWIDQRQPDVLGTLILGVSLDNRPGRAVQGADEQRDRVRRERARSRRRRCRERPGRRSRRCWASPGVSPASSSAARTTSPSPIRSGRQGRRGQPIGIVLRSQTERLRFLTQLHTLLGATAVVAVLVAVILLSYAIARTVTRPLEAITSTMREMAASGDLVAAHPGAPDDALAGRRRPAPRDHVQLDDRFDRALPARGGAARAAVVARPAVHGGRPRDPQPADDHQDVAAIAAAGGRAARNRSRRRPATSTRRSPASTGSSRRCSTTRARSSSSWRRRPERAGARRRPRRRGRRRKQRRAPRA